MTYFNRRNVDVEPWIDAIAVILAEANLTLTVKTWMPAPPENRRLPMPLEYA